MSRLVSVGSEQLNPSLQNRKDDFFLGHTPLVYRNRCADLTGVISIP